MSKTHINSWGSDPKRKRRGLLPGANEGEFVLQITSMADIFTIILVFLLKNISMGANGFTAPVGMNLPDSGIQSPVSDGARLEINSKELLFEGRKLASVSELGDLAVKKRIQDALAEEYRRGGKHELMLVADRGTSYQTVQAAMESASRAGFEGFKLLVVEDK